MSTTSPPTITITPTTDLSLVPRLARIHRLAFDHTALHRALFPGASVSPEAQEAWRSLDLAAYMSPYHVARGRTVLVATLGAPGAPVKAEEVVGYAIWQEIRPGRVLTAEEEAVEVPKGAGAPPEGTNFELAGDYFGRMEEKRAARTGDRFHLNAVGVDPAFQRRGVASALIRWGLEQADAAGLPTDLNATPEGQATYAKLGFVAAEPAVVAKDGSFYSTFMARPVPAAAP